MHNKLLRYLFCLSLVIAGGILLHGPGATGVTCSAPHERTCNGTSQADVNACINGGADGVTTWCKAVDGDIIHLKPIPSSTWDTPIIVDKNVQIYGAGVGVGGTHINGGQVWRLKPHGGTLQPRMIVSNMHINKDRPADPTFDITGVCPINDAHISDPTQSGGFSVDHIVITATNNPAGQGHLFHVGGWAEGDIHHNVVDLDVMPAAKPNQPPGGEWIIINFNGTPTTQTGSGFWAWTHDPPTNSHHLLTIEDNIFHRHGAIDSNQWATGSAGGAMYRARHNTLWHGTSGHGGPSDSHVWGIRFEDAHKNLYVRGQEEGVDAQAGNMVDVRGGEAIAWGNRMNRYGVNNGTAANTFQIECNVISSGLSDDMTGGPDGTNPWFDNQKGPFSIGSIDYAPVNGYLRTYVNPWMGNMKIINGVDSLDDGSPTGAPSLAGDVYLAGKGGQMLSVHTFALTQTEGGAFVTTPTAHKWENFMVVNLSKQQGLETGPSNPFGNPGNEPPPGTLAAPSTQTYAYVISHAEVSGKTVFTKLTTNIFDAKPTEWAIDSNDLWEIRRVKKFLNAAGHGSGDSLVNENTAGNPNFRNALRLESGTPNPRWTNEPTDFGVHEWDNMYRITSSPTAWQNIAEWGALLGNCAYACTGFVGHGSSVPVNHPRYPYTYDSTTQRGAATGGSQGLSGTELRAATRVGADAVTWTLVPPNGFLAHQDDGCSTNTTPCEGVDSFYEPGTGGPPYPHPFSLPTGPNVSASGPTFTIGGTDACGASPPTNCVHITTSGFTSQPDITIDSWSPALADGSTITLSTTSGTGVGTIHGTASGNSSGQYTTTIHADKLTQHALATLDITLQAGSVPITVNLTSPKDGDSFTNAETINFSADASGGTGITKVEFYEGTNLLNSGGDTTDPYTYSTKLPSKDSGPYVIKAKAYSGAVTKESDTINIQVGPTSAASPPAILQIKP